MVQPSLPLPDAPRTPRASVNAERDRILAAQAKRHGQRFGELARGIVLTHLAQHGPTSAEVLTDAAMAALPADVRPNDARAFGGVYMSLLKRGSIVKVCAVRREKGHGCAGGAVYAVRGN